MRVLLIVAALGTATVALASEPPRPDPRLYAAPSADESPTAWACTSETLLRGTDCVFESGAQPAGDAARQASDNAAAATGLARRACEKAAVVEGGSIDKDLLALCLADAREVAGSCRLEGGMPLLDDKDRFSAEGRACYQSLSEVLRRTRLMASISVRCCRCAARAGCSASFEQCNRDLTSGTPRLPTCAANKCARACDAFTGPDEPARPTAPGPQRRGAQMI